MVLSWSRSFFPSYVKCDAQHMAMDLAVVVRDEVPVFGFVNVVHLGQDDPTRVHAVFARIKHHATGFFRQRDGVPRFHATPFGRLDGRVHVGAWAEDLVPNHGLSSDGPECHRNMVPKTAPVRVDGGIRNSS